MFFLCIIVRKQCIGGLILYVDLLIKQWNLIWFMISSKLVTHKKVCNVSHKALRLQQGVCNVYKIPIRVQCTTSIKEIQISNKLTESLLLYLQIKNQAQSVSLKKV